jgi:VanZ family protein
MRPGDSKHLFGCMAIAVLVAVGLALFWRSQWVIPIAFFASFGTGVAYEYWQKLTGANFEKRDILFDLIGAWFGVGLSAVIISIFLT